MSTLVAAYAAAVCALVACALAAARRTVRRRRAAREAETTRLVLWIARAVREENAREAESEIKVCDFVALELDRLGAASGLSRCQILAATKVARVLAVRRAARMRAEADAPPAMPPW